MTDKNNNSHNFEQVHGCDQCIVHNKFLNPVQNLFQFKNTQKPQEPEEPGYLDQAEQLSTLGEISISCIRISLHVTRLRYSRRLLNYPVVRKRCNEIDEEPGLYVIDNNLFSIVNQLALAVEASVELYENVKHEANVDRGLQVNPITFGLSLKAKSEWNDDRLVNNHKQACNLPSS